MFKKPQTPTTIQEYFEKLDEKEYTDQELRAFGQEIEKYRIHKTLNNGKAINYVKIEDYLKDQGAISPDGAIRVKAEPYIDHNSKETWKYDSHRNKNRVLMNKYRQWLDYIGRVQYTKKMEVKELDKLATSMKIENGK